jgi:hypothetical protein
MSRTKNVIDLKLLAEDDEPEEVLETLNTNINELNTILSKLSFDNFDCQIVKVTIPATSTLRINHRLKTIPLYRIILRQTGGGVITDSTFSDTYIELTNNGATSCELTVAIMRG